jgi:hypothetical protein
MPLESSLPYTICLSVHEKRPEIFVCLREMIKVYWVELLKNLERCSRVCRGRLSGAHTTYLSSVTKSKNI